MFTPISTALAQTNNLGTPVETGVEALALVTTITNWFFAVLLTIAVIFIILAAYSYLTSGGGEGAAKAHKRLIYAIVAVVVAVLAKGIVLVAAKIVGGNVRL